MLSTSNEQGKLQLKSLKQLFEGGMVKQTDKVNYRGGLTVNMVGNRWEVGRGHYVDTEIQPQQSTRLVELLGQVEDSPMRFGGRD